MKNSSLKSFNTHNIINDYYLQNFQETDFINTIDMEALEKGIQNSEKDIAEGRVIEFKEAMLQIHKELFGEKI